MARVFTRHILRPINPFSSLLLPDSSISSPSPFSSAYSSTLRQRQSESESVSLPNSILETLVKCRTLRHLSQIHALLITSGYTQKPFFAAKLLKLSCELKDLNYTLSIFRNIAFSNRVCVNTVISAYSASSVALQGVFFYFQMLKVGFFANSFSFPPLLSCCARSGCSMSGQKCHGQAIKRGVDDIVEIQNCLIHMYGCFGLIHVAADVFDKMQERDLISWHSLIGAFCKVGAVQNAHNLFDVMPVKNVVSWNVMMTGYLDNNKPGLVLKLFRQMEKTGFIGNSSTLVSVLTASGRSARLKEGMSVHGFLMRRKWCKNLILDTAIIEMYSKCRKLEAAQRTFDGLSERNLVCWNSMIMGHCLHGNPQQGLELFEEMVEKAAENEGVGLTPDAITFVSVLCACTRASLLEKGRVYFHQMVHKFGVRPNFAHYWCMANLLASNGLTHEAVEFVRKVDEFNGDLPSESVIWASLLGLCRFQGHAEPGEQVAKSLIQLEPQNIMWYALLFNVYSAAARWDDVLTLKATIREKFAGTKVGCSLMDLIEIVHRFTMEKSTVDELFQRQDLACLLPSQLLSRRHCVSELGSQG